MTFVSAIIAALSPWVQAFFEALLPFLKTQAEQPVQRTAAEKDPAIEQEVQDAIDAYDHHHGRAAAD